MYTIALIGAGQLGSRHLQGLAKISLPVSLAVVDPSRTSLEMSRERFEQISRSTEVNKIEFLTSLDDLPGNIDLAILATTANVRASVTRELLKKKQVKNIVFEKVVFQCESDFDQIQNLLQTQTIKAWVNCPRREYAFYQEIKNYFHPSGKIALSLSGGEWGLACNAIHFLDLMAFLSSNYPLEIDPSGLDDGFIESTRKGFVEVTGTLRGYFSDDSEFNIISMKGSAAPHIITILSSTVELIIDEGRGRASIARKDTGWKWEEIMFRTPYQSELTNVVVENILQKGTCNLPIFDESAMVQKPFLRAILKHLNMNAEDKTSKCPIT